MSRGGPRRGPRPQVWNPVDGDCLLLRWLGHTGSRRAGLCLLGSLPAFGSAKPLYELPGATIDPTYGTEITQVARGTALNVDKAVKAACPGSGLMGGHGRLRARGHHAPIADGIRANRDIFGLLDTLDSGRPIRDTSGSSIDAAACAMPGLNAAA